MVRSPLPRRSVGGSPLVAASLHSGTWRSQSAATPNQLAAVLVALYAIALPIGDLAWSQQAFNRLGANASLPILALLSAVAVRRTKQQGGTLAVFLRGACWFLMYALAVTLALAIVQAFVSADQSGGAQIAALAKGSRFAVTVAFSCLSVVVGGWAFQCHREALLRGLQLSLVLQVGILVAEIGHPGLMFSASFWHFLPDSQLRVRLLQSESSTAGGVLLATGAALAFVDRRVLRVVATSLLSVGSAVLVESRGASLTLVISAAVAMLVFLSVRRSRRDLSLRVVSAVASAALVCLSLFSGVLLASQVIPSDNYTSNATRATYAQAAIHALAAYPFGAGFAQFFPAEQRLLTATVPEMETHFPPNALTEVIGLINQTGTEDLAAKTLPATVIFIGGWVGIVACFLLFQLIFRRVLHTKSAEPRMFGMRLFFCIVVLVSLSSYINGLYEYSLMLVVGCILVLNGQTRASA